MSLDGLGRTNDKEGEQEDPRTGEPTKLFKVRDMEVHRLQVPLRFGSGATEIFYHKKLHLLRL